jgi:UDP:flavonoid glycosyltransferase YjiC (YdhE family)
MRIAILANGTRGDIQPKLALADELQRRGHSVAVTANENLSPWARRSGLEIVTLPLDSEALFRSPDGMASLARGDTLNVIRESTKLELAANMGVLDAMREACRGADLILSNVLTMYSGVSMAEYYGVPHALIATVPWIPTADFPCLLAPVRSLPSKLLNRASYELFLWLMWKGGQAAQKEQRRVLGLPELKRRPRIEGLPTFGIYSQALSPRPPEWGEDQPVTGFITPTPELRARLGEAALPEGLERWLNAGDAPVFFGFGSMPVQEPQRMAEMVSRVTRKKGLRALIGAGWTQYGASDALGEHVFIAPAFDHERVLPRCRAAVHHGGAGTTGAALRAGLPSLIATVFADQPYWAWRVERAGAGLATRFRDLSEPMLDRAHDQLLGLDMQHAAQALGAKVRAESGAVGAADEIERVFGSRPSQLSAA